METFQEYLQAWPSARRAEGAARATEADVLAVLTTSTMFAFQFKRSMAELEKRPEL